jgi:hypothetical protein
MSKNLLLYAGIAALAYLFLTKKSGSVSTPGNMGIVPPGVGGWGSTRPVDPSSPNKGGVPGGGFPGMPTGMPAILPAGSLTPSIDNTGVAGSNTAGGVTGGAVTGSGNPVAAPGNKPQKVIVNPGPVIKTANPRISTGGSPTILAPKSKIYKG